MSMKSIKKYIDTYQTEQNINIPLHKIVRSLSSRLSLTKNNRFIFCIACMLLISVITISAFTPLKANAATSIAPRFQPAFKSESAYAYYTSKNIYYNSGYGMPNCTCYAYGRIYEILGKEPNLCHYDASEWYDYNKEHGYYKYGQTPKIGAVACWSYGSSGHVAVVEAIAGDKIIMSQSGYGYLNFYLSLEDYNNPGEDNWKFQGYIYPGEFTSSGFEGELYRTVDYTGSLNFRSGPGLSYKVLDTLDYHMGFIVTEKVEGDGYTWGKTTYNGKTGYIALTSNTQFLYSSGTSPEPPPEKQINEFYIITSSNGVNMRSGASTSNSKVGVIPYNAYIRVTQIKENDGYIWGYTTYNNTNGWCALNYAEKVYGAENSTQFVDYLHSKTHIEGDVNGDGEMNISDATAIQMYLANFWRITESSFKCADMDNSGFVTISDVTSIQMKLAGF